MNKFSVLARTKQQFLVIKLIGDCNALIITILF